MSLVRTLKQLFTADTTSNEASEADRLRMAAAGLMLEVSKADFDESEIESRTMDELLSGRFHLSDDELAALKAASKAESDVSNNLHPMTRLINEHYDLDQKSALLETLWQIAFADGVLDKYEEALIRKIADLVYVPHSKFIQAKLKTQPKEP